MSKADMIICYKRVHAVWADRTDPRRRFFNAFNVWDGTGDAVRLDFVANTSSFADDTHKWHTHGELRRRYVNDAQAGRAWLSMTGGQTKATWIAQEGDDMTLADDVWAVKIGSPGLGVAPTAAADWIKQGMVADRTAKALNAEVTASFKTVNQKLDEQHLTLTPEDRAAIVADIVTALVPQIEAAAERAVRKVAADASTP